MNKHPTKEYIQSSQISGRLETHHVRVPGENYHRVTWKISNIGLQFRNKKIFKSRLFTLGTADDCKWYLMFENLRKTGSKIPCVLYLGLDDTSDCKTATVKFRLSLSVDRLPKEKSISENSEIFKFVKQNESLRSSSATLNSSSADDYRSGYRTMYATVHFIIITCEMIVESTIPDCGFKGFESELKNQLYSDVVILVGEKQYPAHKIILGQSPVFAAIFAHQMEKNDENMVQIRDIDEEVFEAMLHYMYTGKIEDYRDIASDLLLAADKYDLKELRAKCEEFLIENFSSRDAEKMYKLAESCCARQLESKAVDFISNEIVKLFGSTAVQIREISSKIPSTEGSKISNQQPLPNSPVRGREGKGNCLIV